MMLLINILSTFLAKWVTDQVPLLMSMRQIFVSQIMSIVIQCFNCVLTQDTFTPLDDDPNYTSHFTYFVFGFRFYPSRVFYS